MLFCESDWWFTIASKLCVFGGTQFKWINNSENGKISRVEELYCTRGGMRTRAPSPPFPNPSPPPPLPSPPTPWSHSRCQNRTNCRVKKKACMHQISPLLFHESKQNDLDLRNKFRCTPATLVSYVRSCVTTRGGKRFRTALRWRSSCCVLFFCYGFSAGLEDLGKIMLSVSLDRLLQ